MKFDREWVPPIVVGAIVFAAGAAVGYFVSSRKTSSIGDINQKVEKLEDKQLEFDFEKENRDYSFNSLYLRGEERLESITQQIWERDKESFESREEEEPELQAVNVFAAEEDDGWDYAEEELKRTTERPYVIHRDEFFSNEKDYDQTTLEYYAGDNILCDEKDVPLYDADKIVGELKFGWGSHDISVCYIRNDRLEAEYEVLLNEGTFQHEILGEEAEEGEVKHSLHKFRSD